MNPPKKTTTSRGKDKPAKKNKFHSLGELFGDFQFSQDKGYITQEFQDYGYRLAAELDDLKHKSLYIRMAKNEDRSLLERARSFVIDSQAKNKGALFMWKIKQLKQEREASAEGESKAEELV
jgi:hypothetical protein